MAKRNIHKVKGDRYYGKTARNYEVIRSKQGWWAVEQREMKSLLELLPEGLSVVDIPFGTGRFVPYYIERGFETNGLDSSDAMIDQAREILGSQMEGVNVRRGFSTELPFENNQFDLLVSTRFLRDIITFADVKTTMAEFARVTKQYAILQLGVKLVEPFEPPAEDQKMGSNLSEAQLEEFLKGFGFEVMDSRKVKGTPNNSSEIRHFLLKRV